MVTIQNSSKKIILSQDKNEKWMLWEKALKQNNLPLSETLIQENMEYLHWSKEEVLSCWGEKGTQKIKEKWINEDPKTQDEINKYYNNLDLYIPELSSWHAINRNEDIIKIVEFLQLNVRKRAKSYLDYCAGIGSAALFFRYYGFSVTLADISDSMLNYAKWRFKRHKDKANFIDLKKNKLPLNKFDCAMSMEVLEHVTNPEEIINNIGQSLKKGGLLFITTPFYKDKDRPQHLIHDMYIANKFEKQGLKRVSNKEDKIYRIFEKVE